MTMLKSRASLLLTGFGLFALLMMPACGSKKKAQKGEQLLEIYCSGKEYRSDKKHFRANAVGESLDQMTARKKAMNEAKGQLAASISTTLKSVTDNYVNSREYNNREEVEERFESLNREVVEQRLNNVATICEKLTKTKEGRYKSYVAVEMDSDEIIEGYNGNVSEDERLRIDYDYEKFKEEFYKEMQRKSGS